MQAKRGVVGISRYARCRGGAGGGEEMGCNVIYEYDAGVAGIHRLVPCLESLPGEDGRG